MLWVCFGGIALAAPPSDCSQAIKSVDVYKGVMATVSNVTARKMVGEGGSFYIGGMRYDFTFTYPNGYVGRQSAFLPHNSKYKVANGDKMIWVPGPEIVRIMYPDEDQRVPAIVNKSCEAFVIDYAMPAKKIAGI